MLFSPVGTGAAPRLHGELGVRTNTEQIRLTGCVVKRRRIPPNRADLRGQSAEGLASAPAGVNTQMSLYNAHLALRASRQGYMVCSRERLVLIQLHNYGKIALGFAIALSLAPGTALAETAQSNEAAIALFAAEDVTDEESPYEELIEKIQANVKALADQVAKEAAKSAENASTSKKSSSASSSKASKFLKSEATDKVLAYDRSLIDRIGTQEKTGHTICCPSFSCAYGDAVLDGAVHDHSYYTCSCCTWTDWGGGGSSDRCVGTTEQLLREAYDQISKGKPTVIHVAGASGEHWICLIGYQGAKDPDHLQLSNFIALDPWDGAQITATDRYQLYGDGCEHISER